MHIAFVLIAEAYQCYHGAAIAFELAAMPDVSVTIYYNDPEAPRHMERIRNVYVAPPLEYVPMKRGPLTRIVQQLRVFGLTKKWVLSRNAHELMRYEAVFALEDVVAQLFSKARGDRPVKIHMSHGSGDRAVGFSPRISAFDFVLLTGQKTADRLLGLNFIAPGRYALPGYAKLETAFRLRGAIQPFFADDRPIVLYNPHKARGLSSWGRFIEPMLEQFGRQDAFNLIVAPHVKMFHRRPKPIHNRWRQRSTSRILIDPGSDHSLDNSYTSAAAIYVGDVSSQVYEFLAEPRPCVFLNAHGLDWRDDPNFRCWHLGDVVEDPAMLMDAIRAAPARHHLYRDAQSEMAAQSLGDTSPGASRRAAEKIIEFLRKGYVEP